MVPPFWSLLAICLICSPGGSEVISERKFRRFDSTSSSNSTSISTSTSTTSSRSKASLSTTRQEFVSSSLSSTITSSTATSSSLTDGINPPPGYVGTGGVGRSSSTTLESTSSSTTTSELATSPSTTSELTTSSSSISTLPTSSLTHGIEPPPGYVGTGNVGRLKTTLKPAIIATERPEPIESTQPAVNGTDKFPSTSRDIVASAQTTSPIPSESFTARNSSSSAYSNSFTPVLGTTVASMKSIPPSSRNATQSYLTTQSRPLRIPDVDPVLPTTSATSTYSSFTPILSTPVASVRPVSPTYRNATQPQLTTQSPPVKIPGDDSAQPTILQASSTPALSILSAPACGDICTINIPQAGLDYWWPGVYTYGASMLEVASSDGVPTAYSLVPVDDPLDVTELLQWPTSTDVPSFDPEYNTTWDLPVFYTTPTPVAASTTIVSRLAMSPFPPSSSIDDVDPTLSVPQLTVVTPPPASAVISGSDGIDFIASSSLAFLYFSNYEVESQKTIIDIHGDVQCIIDKQTYDLSEAVGFPFNGNPDGMATVSGDVLPEFVSAIPQSPCVLGKWEAAPTVIVVVDITYYEITPFIVGPRPGPPPTYSAPAQPTATSLALPTDPCRACNLGGDIESSATILQVPSGTTVDAGDLWTPITEANGHLPPFVALIAHYESSELTLEYPTTVFSDSGPTYSPLVAHYGSKTITIIPDSPVTSAVVTIDGHAVTATIDTTIGVSKTPGPKPTGGAAAGSSHHSGGGNSKGGSPGTKGGLSPSAGGSPPNRGSASPSKGGSSPAQGGSSPSEGGSSSGQGGSSPGRGGSSSAKGGSSLANAGGNVVSALGQGSSTQKAGGGAAGNVVSAINQGSGSPNRGGNSRPGSNSDGGSSKSGSGEGGNSGSGSNRNGGSGSSGPAQADTSGRGGNDGGASGSGSGGEGVDRGNNGEVNDGSPGSAGSGRTGPQPFITVGGNAIAAQPVPRVTVGGRTIQPGGAPVTVDGRQVWIPSSGGTIVVDGTTRALPAVGSQPTSFNVGGLQIQEHQGAGYVIGSQTLVAGGPAITAHGTPVSMNEGAVFVGGSTIALARNAQATGVAAPQITVDGHTFTANAAGGYVLGPGETLTPGGTVTMNGNEVVSLGASGSFFVVNGVTSTIAGPAITPAPSGILRAIAQGSNGGATYMIGGQELTPGGVITYQDSTISLGPSGNYIVVDGVTTDLAAPGASAVPALTIDGRVYRAEAGSHAYVIDGQTLTPGGEIVVDGTTISLEPSASAVVVDGITSSLSLNGNLGAPVLTFDGQTYTVGSSNGDFVINGETLTPGGQIIIHGTTISLSPDDKTAVINGVTQTLDASLPGATSAAVLTFDGQTYTASTDSGDFVIDGQTLTPGGQIVVHGTTISLSPDDKTAVIDGVTQTLDASSPSATGPAVITFEGHAYTANSGGTFTIDGQTLIPGGKITVDGIVISLAPDDVVAVVGGITETLNHITTVTVNNAAGVSASAPTVAATSSPTALGAASNRRPAIQLAIASALALGLFFFSV
ncbi:MAG: hypothetical protein M1820_004417 [Bogoriella megaspora]|nr:MAG: hypothetical protein M1820_004417 [Bogoriella megaspora]